MAAPTLRVLVVDDDPDTVDSTLLVLEVWGYDPFGAYDGATALALAAERRPHVVLFDNAGTRIQKRADFPGDRASARGLMGSRGVRGAR